ncbi:hypothetical protein JMJ35_009971 [Cladonia borealis]|uniref:DASH complex subunit ASK1 n=1 Tax=Cladonia borealis TaxID=184061 RepID=A0AA39UXD2_9LECA|nr:hypothetical protein JMJ35_009971 [Cladonia borealis]
MSRPSVAAQRNLTLTEELEKLEQSITLTLQEIDHNFSRAHRIVTTSILPIVENYAEHSKNVWEGSKFWKQFFEASANVSLSGYEEPPAEDETVTEEDLTSTATPSTSTYNSPDQPTQTPANNRTYHPNEDDSLLSPSPIHRTPRPSKPPKPHPTTAPYSSPYEALKRETFPTTTTNNQDNTSSTLPSTPRQPISPDPQSSPFAPPSTSHHTHTSRRTPAAQDILLHRVLDKNYRLQATPHSTARLPQRSKSLSEQTPKPSVARTRLASKDDSDLDSSPLAAPELHAEIFGTPAARKGGRVPGVSVLTPKRGREGSAVRGGGGRGKPQQQDLGWDSESEEGEGEEGGMMGFSPPKTMQFHIPQGRLMRTPAREASKRIVEDLLLTAGGNVTDDLEEDSPSVVRRVGVEEEDTF